MKHNDSEHRHSQHGNFHPAITVTPAPLNLDREEADFVPSPDEVARRAYFTYVNEGSPPGREVQHWLTAESDLIAERNLNRVHGSHHRTQENPIADEPDKITQ